MRLIESYKITIQKASLVTVFMTLNACAIDSEQYRSSIDLIPATEKQRIVLEPEATRIEPWTTGGHTTDAQTTALTFKYDGFGPAHAPSKDGHYSYEYGFNGNLKRKSHPVQGQETYKYNHHHKLSRVRTFIGDRFDYLYDASGNRVAKRLNDGEEIERYFAAGIEKRGNKTLKFFFAGSKRLAEKSDSDNLAFYHQDNLGSTSVVTNRFAQVVTKRTYYEFGAQKESFELHKADHDYNDKRLEKQTKLLDYHARQYAPSFFQFIQPDTIVPRAHDPQSFNRYAYVRNNPLNRVDPTGHADWEAKLFESLQSPTNLELFHRFAQNAHPTPFSKTPSTSFVQMKDGSIEVNVQIEIRYFNHFRNQIEPISPKQVASFETALRDGLNARGHEVGLNYKVQLYQDTSLHGQPPQWQGRTIPAREENTILLFFSNRQDSERHSGPSSVGPIAFLSADGAYRPKKQTFASFRSMDVVRHEVLAHSLLGLQDVYKNNFSGMEFPKPFRQLFMSGNSQGDSAHPLEHLVFGVKAGIPKDLLRPHANQYLGNQNSALTFDELFPKDIQPRQY